MEPLHNSPIASHEPNASPQEKSGENIQSTLDNLPGFKGLSVDLQNQIRATLAKMEQTYSNNLGALKNQRDKFIHEIGTNIDASDLDTSSILIEEILKKMEKDETVVKKEETVAKNTNDVMQTGETVAKNTNDVMQTGETVAKNTNDVMQTGETITQKIQTTESQERNAAEHTQKIEQSARALSQKLTSLSWGKSPESLIPNYASKLEQKQQDLIKLGHDPKLAAGALLVESESEIIQSIKNSPEGKKLSEKDYADLQADFAWLRNMLPTGSQVKKTASDYALVNPNVTLEAYTKIKAGFEPPSTLVYTNPKTGEIISPSALITGERTIMTTSGERFREKDGLRIPSPVPNVSEADTILQNLTLNRQELEQRKRTTWVMSRVTQWEIAEKFPVNQFPKLKIPDLKTEDPEVLQKHLSEFFGSPGYQELRQNPEHQLARENLEQRLKQLYQSVTAQSQLTKNIKSLETKKPEAIIRSRIAEQDQVIDSNLLRLTKLGMGSLGQEKYEKVVHTINKQLKAESSSLIDDTTPITERQGDLLRQALIKLTGMNSGAMYPDGSISSAAIQKLKNIDSTAIENQLLVTTESTK